MLRRSHRWFALALLALPFAAHAAEEARPAAGQGKKEDAKPAAPAAQPAQPAKPPAPKPEGKPADAPAQPAAEPAAEKPAKPVDDGLPPGMMLLNFKNASLKSVLSYVAEKSGLAVNYECTVAGDLTVESPKPMDLEAALGVLNAALVTKQAVAVRSGKMIKVVSLSNAKKSNLPIFTGSDPDAVEEGEQFITQIIPLKIVQADQIAKDLANMVPDHAELATNKNSNTLIYTASATDVKRLLRILHSLDTEISQVASVKVFRLANADAKSVEASIKALFEEGPAGRSRTTSRREMFMRYRMGMSRSSSSSGASGGSSEASQAYRSVKVSSDERTNSVVVVAAKDKLELISQLVDELDKAPTDAIGTIKVYVLQNADATALAQTIESLFETSASSSRSRRGSSIRDMFMRMRFGSSRRSRSSSSDSGGRRAKEYEEVKVSVDTRTNSVIVVASEERHEQIAKLVKELDSDSIETESTMVYKCKFANAVTVANTLNDIFAEANRRNRSARRATRGLGATTSSAQRTTSSSRRPS